MATLSHEKTAESHNEWTLLDRRILRGLELSRIRTLKVKMSQKSAVQVVSISGNAAEKNSYSLQSSEIYFGYDFQKNQKNRLIHDSVQKAFRFNEGNIVDKYEVSTYSKIIKGLLFFKESRPCGLEYHGGKIKFEFLILKIQI